jgi:hypothetical protein
MTTSEMLTPVLLHPDGIYHDGQARLLLGLPGATLARARREGRLRYARQGGRVLYRGSWLLAWLEGDADRTSGKVTAGDPAGEG